MDIGLMGFGKTGRAVASILLESKETTLQWVIRNSKNLEHRSVPEFLGVESCEPGFIYSRDEFSAEELIDNNPVEAIIDFSSESGIEYYGEEARKRRIAIITAISSYNPEKMEYLKEISKDTQVVCSPNITIGINFLIIAAKILKNIAPYTDIEIIEEHFKDKPEISGTAKRIADSLELPEDSIKTVRAGGIIGVHEILFGFPHQTVRLKHESISREAFGNGILFIARHIRDKKNGFYTMEDLLLPYFKINTPAEELSSKPWWKVWN
ncbi:MAG: dihydrodipicolinate reductase [Alphaproteobacteria bacterium]|jgi:4-hydroxy-tetrahydrodipicolinate reductase|nr:dihydrodipicolinate reductase [Alphaproteobacteria bacterium]QQS57791.1 MAG: dihydrodipicolinate reductase [Alphaproteobacteria bacterium]